jgi:hypothetical protein
MKYTVIHVINPVLLLINDHCFRSRRTRRRTTTMVNIRESFLDTVFNIHQTGRHSRNVITHTVAELIQLK